MCYSCIEYPRRSCGDYIRSERGVKRDYSTSREEVIERVCR